MDELVLKITDCKADFKYEGPRFKRLGPESGEEFRDDYLIPWLDSNKGKQNLKIDFDGTVVYTPSFLEESFGGAIRKGYVEVKDIEFINIPNDQKSKIENYIVQAYEKSGKK